MALPTTFCSAERIASASPVNGGSVPLDGHDANAAIARAD